MDVTLNGVSVETDARTLAALIAEHYEELAPGCAVAVNSEVVPRSEVADAPLRHHDRVEVVGAVAGG